MCGRYTVLTGDEIIEIREVLKELSLRLIRDDFEEYDEAPGEVRPTNRAPVITRNSDGIAFESTKWGFQKWNGSGVIINARSETMKQKNTFSKHLETGRCVVPAGAFFEWEKIASGKKKYCAKDRAGNLLFMAGLYRDNLDEREYVIITKEATGDMAKIHDRIPVILRVDQIESWLTGELSPEELKKMNVDVAITPCDEENLEIQISLF